MAHKKMRIQPRDKKHGPKVPSSQGLDHRIAEAVERDAIRWNCSRSWVRATALAAFYGIDIVAPYEVPVRKKLRIVRG
jgi:hypothetical protein